MKTKLIWILVSVFFLTFCIYSVTATIPKKKKEITIEITKKSTQVSLDSLITALDNKGILLKLETTQFNGQGQLQKISGEIHFLPSYHGRFSTDNLDKIIFKRFFGGFSIEINPKNKSYE